MPIMAPLEAGHIACLAEGRTLDELRRVLTYPQLKLMPDIIAERYARYSTRVEVIPDGQAPPCPAARTGTTRNSSNSPPEPAPAS